MRIQRMGTEAQEQARDYLLKECFPRGIALCILLPAFHSSSKEPSYGWALFLILAPWGLAQASPEQIEGKGDIELEE